jgi:hypothetical protein
MRRVPLFLLTICKESAISPTDIMNMRIRSSKVPIVAPMMRGGRKAVSRLED